MRRQSLWLLFPLFLVLPIEHTLADCLYGFVIDRTGSMKPAIDEAVTAARLLIERSGPRDRFFIVAFAEFATLEQQTTDDKQKLIAQLNNLIVTGRPSAILDVLFVSADEVLKSAKPTECRALVLITDGDEEGSQTKRDEVLRKLREHQLPVFAIGFPHIIPKQKGKKAQKEARKLLERLAQSSGGGAWFPRTEAEVATAVGEILKRRD